MVKGMKKPSILAAWNEALQDASAAFIQNECQKARLEEREACAKLVENAIYIDSDIDAQLAYIAKQIRERGKE